MDTAAANHPRSSIESKLGPSAVGRKQLHISPRKDYTDQDQAHSHSPRETHGKKEKSSKLMLEATRNFGCIQRPSREDIEQYKELFYAFIERVPMSDKRLISAMLARGVFTPRSVALYLAQDKIEIAAPFLLYSPVLGDLDLRAIAKKKGSEHAAIVAKRKLPMDDFTVSTLHDVIATPVRQTVKKTEEKMVKPVLSAAESANSSKWLEGEEILALASIGGRLGKKDKNTPVADITEVQPVAIQKPSPIALPKTETRKLLHLARQRQIEGLAIYVEELCGLQCASTLKLIRSQKTELTYLVKALGLSAPHDIQLLMMLAPAIGRDITAYRETKKLLTELDLGICRMIFNEIGARFDIGNNGKMPPVNTSVQNGFSQAIQRRRESLEQTPAPQKSKIASRFSFEQSFLATG